MGSVAMASWLIINNGTIPVNLFRPSVWPSSPHFSTLVQCNCSSYYYPSEFHAVGKGKRKVTLEMWSKNHTALFLLWHHYNMLVSHC